MSTHSQNGCMLIFRGTDWYQGLSPEQMQQVADRWMASFNGLKNEGTAIAGHPLEREDIFQPQTSTINQELNYAQLRRWIRSASPQEENCRLHTHGKEGE